LCNNETIQLSDLSYLPPAASPEHVAKWFWKFDNAGTSNTQHPALYFTPGTHRAKLLVETEYGCKSVEADSVFVVHAKPNIRLDISDSCVFRDIKYAAVDLQGTVDKWYWDFGNGLRRDASVITRKYSTGGNMPVTLIARTPEGCKDTIARPFTIFDNKAFAGRDTMVAMQQPVQLDAHGGANVQYTWTPALGLSDATIENPVAILDRDQLYRLDAITDKGCDSHTKVLIKRYKGPELYIPTAFTPNGDGLNELLKVFPVGIKSFGYMAVFNRYGQQVYRTEDFNQGWDGRLKGTPLETGTYVAIAAAKDYKGNDLVNKVTVVLIR
jgi:gliding motility-associated-like protein